MVHHRLDHDELHRLLTDDDVVVAERCAQESLENCGLSAAAPASRTTFASGAYRDSSDDKIDFEGHLSPLAEEVAARYMHKHRLLPDGSRRDPDNWKRGISLDSYIKSLCRHLQDLRRLHRGLPSRDGADLFDTVGAIQFNVNGYAHEIEKARIASGPQPCMSRAINESCGLDPAARCPICGFEPSEK